MNDTRLTDFPEDVQQLVKLALGDRSTFQLFEMTTGPGLLDGEGAQIFSCDAIVGEMLLRMRFDRSTDDVLTESTTATALSEVRGVEINGDRAQIRFADPEGGPFGEDSTEGSYRIFVDPALARAVIRRP